ncbi:MAG TPA: hypothetical protein VLJ15_04035 [Gammaproteobacteria bacterium]|nr:hypothetical protein [Gammaproteobacteria bacterium]
MNQEHQLVCLSLNMSPELNAKLEKMSADSHTDKTDILKKAIFLLDIAMENTKKGNRIAILDQQNHQVGDISGV